MPKHFWKYFSKMSENRISLVIGKDFRALQEERVLHYKVLNDAHKIYLATGPLYDLVLLFSNSYVWYWMNYDVTSVRYMWPQYNLVPLLSISSFLALQVLVMRESWWWISGQPDFWGAVWKNLINRNSFSFRISWENRNYNNHLKTKQPKYRHSNFQTLERHLIIRDQTECPRNTWLGRPFEYQTF